MNFKYTTLYSSVSHHSLSLLMVITAQKRLFSSK